jgi:hypothetical protein
MSYVLFLHGMDRRNVPKGVIMLEHPRLGL